MPLSQSHKYEWKGINKSKLLAGLSSAGLVQFTFLLYGYIYIEWESGIGGTSARTRRSHDAPPVQSRQGSVNWEGGKNRRDAAAVVCRGVNIKE